MQVNQDTHNAQSKLTDSNESTGDKLSILVVSGRSGSGKTSVLNILEDLGFYSIDNLPLSLVPEAAQKLVCDSGIKRIALGVDIRTPRADLSNFDAIHDSLKQTYGEEAVTVMYVTAQEETLVARFNATRRIHPLMVLDTKGVENNVYNLPAAIEKEIQLLQPIFKHADIKIDTSMLNIHQLKERLRDYVGVDNQIVINLLSFGFKYGSPIDADFVFDVRILPNPHWNPTLRSATGLDAEVGAFFADYPEVAEMTGDIATFLNRWLPDFLHNNRHTVTVAIGCTGGKHRSVFITKHLQDRLQNSLPEGLTVTAKHREKHRW
ncbi:MULTISPECIES: RNase adapter RapZ [unclassified Psychrobacter]|uniref:RNase adapter RapZ n=1 Tax=unclassified Psychrobacter TaxID=196806 RepID=UPI0015E603E2|nr:MULTISPECIES: RNase adapter RapZ [unclassified Psychrobacter]MBA2056483.1 RNase adapter RapZ [Psychrobacter sp. D2]|tara:strand:+ start:9203 stop:10165 length:963 start_codon:yes stop_codon:yes gene_type:complete